MKFVRLSSIVFALLLLTSCNTDGTIFDPEEHDFIDRPLKLSRDDFRDMIPRPDKPNNQSLPGAKGMSEASGAPIPKMSQILVAPRPPKSVQEQYVSLAVTEDIPLRDVFIELARLANLDLEMDPNISGGVIFRAKDKPLGDVVERLTRQAGLRYEFKGNVLKIERDTPFLASYTIDFLNMNRSAQGGITINTNVLSAGEGGGDSLNTGSNSAINVSSESDLWEQFEEALKQILESDDGKGQAPDAAFLEISDPSALAMASAGGEAPKSFYVLNKQGGLLTIYGNKFKQEKVETFVKHLQKSASAQVLIEAKIVEVTLDEEFRSGIDWGALSLNKEFDFNFDIDAADASSPGNLFTASINEDGRPSDIEAAVNLTETFGTARTLSSPRLHAINNQQAVLTFAENQVYFEISVERETDTNSAANQELLTVDSQIKTVPIGIILVVQPSINLDTDEVTLNVRPTLSRVTSQISDPAVAFLASQATNLATPLENLIPVVEVRELDTIMKVHSGDIMIMGGLMEERTINTDKGVPFVSRVPYFGNLFKATSKESDIVEMVIFIKATIVPNTGFITKEDINFYKKFTADPHPLAF